MLGPNKVNLAFSVMCTLGALILLIAIVAVAQSFYDKKYVNLEEYNYAMKYCKGKGYEGVVPNSFDHRVTQVYCATELKSENPYIRPTYITEDIE